MQLIFQALNEDGDEGLEFLARFVRWATLQVVRYSGKALNKFVPRSSPLAPLGI